MKKNNNLTIAIESVLNSYAQIFFSKNLSAALLILLASFVNWRLGLWGLAAVLLSNGLAAVLGFDRQTIREGLFGLNSLLVAFGLALSYQPNGQFVLILFAATIMTLFLSVGSLYLLARLGLPMLSLPFLLSFWIILLASRQYTGLAQSEAGIFFLNEMYSVGGTEMIGWYEKINHIGLPPVLGNYFHSLAAIIFQENLLAGFVLSLAILLSSRIAWTLSWFGFLMGYWFYQVMGADITQLHYSYIGFNFVLTAIALGGFFFIPSWRTFLLVAVTAPVIALIIAASSALLTPFGLPVYSLPFVAIVILVVYITHFSRNKPPLHKVVIQQYSPERNLYAYSNYYERFSKATFLQIALPFFGEWRVSQGHNSKPTHQGDWQHAWDFDIVDNNGKTYQGEGYELQDYYCYNLPVVAPADGHVVEVEDEIPDNKIGEVNLQHNWGNSVVLKHGEYLFSKLSHLKAGSFQVKKGDFVKRGDPLANLGNSGRSPEPHIHFQIQANPYIGSKTLKYPIAYFMEKSQEGFSLKSFDIPTEGETIFNVRTTALLEKAFKMQPGKVLHWQVEESRVEPDSSFEAKISEVRWEVFTTPANQTYIYCHESGSVAYFVNEGSVFYFTGFEGDRQSLLYLFYLGAYKVILGYYKSLRLSDMVPLDTISMGPGKWIQDFLAPFFQFKKSDYEMSFEDLEDMMRPSAIVINSSVSLLTLGRRSREMNFKTTLKDQEIYSFEIRRNGSLTMATLIEKLS